jgi:hypothetical protein
MDLARSSRTRVGVIRGVHAVAIAAILLSAVSMRATEFYTTRYQSLPVLDWLESRPPLTESAEVPAASDLVRGMARTLPLLTIRDDARPRTPEFGPPAFFQRTIGGVRDASRIELGTPGPFKVNEEPVHARMDVIVFNRERRAAAWSELMSHELDIKDPDTGAAQARMAGPEQADAVWVIAPRHGGGIATVVGHRGPVAYVLKVTLLRSDNATAADLVDLSARAESLARQASADWTAWLARQLAA